jgi:glycosyltransferase involved in cell wall biosynthesis
MIAGHRARQGDEVEVLGFAMPPGGSYFSYPDDARILTPVAARGLTPLTRLVEIRKLMRKTEPHLVLSFLTKVNVLSLLAATGLALPVVISERNNPRAQTAHPIWRRAQHQLAGRAAAIVMQTERARADLPAAIRVRARVIPNPCAPLTGIAAAPSPSALRLAAVGRLDRQKGFDLLLRAMPAIRAACPGVRLTIHGEGPERGILEALRDRLGLGDVVRFPGVSARPGAWMAESDILIAPSRYEGFPNVIAEATVSGLPVVASDCDYGARELIQDGENGLLVPPEDTAALAGGVIRLIRNPELRLRMAAASDLNRIRLDPIRILGEWDLVINRFARGTGAAGAAGGLSAVQ